MVLNKRTYNSLHAQYLREVARSPDGVPVNSFGTWLYRYALFLIAVAPGYDVDELPTEEQIRGFEAILWAYKDIVAS